MARFRALAACVCLWGCSSVLGLEPLAYDAVPTDAGVQAGVPMLQLSSDSVDFGTAACGGAPPAPVSLSVTNPGTAPLEWSAALSATAQFKVDGPSNGVVPPGSSFQLQLSSVSVPGADAPAATRQALLTIASNDPARPSVDLAVQIASTGGALDVVPQVLSFGESPVTAAALDIDVLLRNTGNESVTVELSQPSNPQYSLTWTGAPAPVTLAPGESVPGLVGKYTPTATGTTTATAAIVVKGVTCGTVLSGLTLSGTGSASKASVQPALLDFGLVACGTAAASKPVTIGNVGVTPFDFSAALVKGANSAFTLSAAAGTIPPTSSTILNVIPKAISTTAGLGDNLYGDTLGISTTAAGDSPHAVALRMTPQGVVLVSNKTEIHFGNVAGNGSKSLTFTLTNQGNQTAAVTLTKSGAPAFSVKPTSANIGAGAALVATVTCAPTASSGQRTGAITIATSSPQCKPLPAPIDLACNVP
jgi:hypothetical protein